MGKSKKELRDEEVISILREIGMIIEDDEVEVKDNQCEPKFEKRVVADDIIDNLSEMIDADIFIQRNIDIVFEALLSHKSGLFKDIDVDVTMSYYILTMVNDIEICISKQKIIDILNTERETVDYDVLYVIQDIIEGLIMLEVSEFLKKTIII